MAVGTVAVWSPSRGSGWIKPDSGGDRVYVHKSGIADRVEGTAPRLEKGQRVEFQIGQRPKGPSAINVRPASEAAAAAPAAETDTAVEESAEETETAEAE